MVKKSKKEIITVRISKYLTNELAEQIASWWGSTAPKYVDAVRGMIFDEMQYGGETFEVIAETGDGTLVGRVHCVRSKADPGLWYYGDLLVVPAYRRRGIASHMVRAAMGYLSETGAKTLRCYVDSDNDASIALQRSLGFTEKPYETFVTGSGVEFVHADDARMFERCLDSDLTMIPAAAEEAGFCASLYLQDREAKNGEAGDEDWRKLRDTYAERFSAADPDKAYRLLCKGAMPVAFLSLTSLAGNDTAVIGELLVSPSYRRRGIGSFAVAYAEELAARRGCSSVGVDVAPDNEPAKNLFKKLGFSERADGASGTCAFRKALGK